MNLNITLGVGWSPKDRKYYASVSIHTVDDIGDVIGTHTNKVPFNPDQLSKASAILESMSYVQGLADIISIISQDDPTLTDRIKLPSEEAVKNFIMKVGNLSILEGHVGE